MEHHRDQVRRVINEYLAGLDDSLRRVNLDVSASLLSIPTLCDQVNVDIHDSCPDTQQSRACLRGTLRA